MIKAFKKDTFKFAYFLTEHSVPVPPPAPPPPPLPPPAPAPLDVQPPSPPSNPPVHHAGPDPRSALMDAIRSGKALKVCMKIDFYKLNFCLKE